MGFAQFHRGDPVLVVTSVSQPVSFGMPLYSCLIVAAVGSDLGIFGAGGKVSNFLATI